MTIIVGGGVFGLSIGWLLAQKNIPVTVIERGTVGQGASWVAAGMLMPWKLSDSFSDALFHLQQESHNLWTDFAAQLMAFTASDIQYQTDGRYFIAVSDKAHKRLRRQFEYHQQIGFPVEWLSGDEVRAREPNLGPKVQAAVFSLLGHRVDNRKLVQALRDALLKTGGRLLERTNVEEILVEDGRARGVRLAKKTLLSDTVIVAAGAWSGKIPGLPAKVTASVQPRKGQTIILQMSSAAPLIKHPMLGPVYLVPRTDHRLIVGTTVEREAGFDTQPTVGGALKILNKATDMVPAIESLPILEFAAGLRPTGLDRLPVLGITPIKGLIAATGGHSYGILLTPVVAQAISNLVVTGHTPDIIKPFVP
jgi:glycine oxidase